MSLAACMRRWPATTRSPWLAYWLAPRYGLRTDACASLICRNSGSMSSRPSIRAIQQRVPTLPTPTTLRAMSVKSYCSSRTRRSDCRVRRYSPISTWSSVSITARSMCAGSRSEIGPDAQPPVLCLAQFAERLLAVVGPRLRHRGVHRPPLTGFQLVRESLLVPAEIYLGVPDVQVVHAREYAHRRAVPAHRRQHDPPPVLAAEPVVPGRHLQAGGQPLDVPLPRAGQGLVEVVD